tara:strand:- start:435 stop:698 length:264 start_codon:yes stop_codon:yes gene_type:complete
MKNIYAYLEFQLKFPYSQSAETLIDLSILWHSRIINVSTRKAQANIAMPSQKFKMMFGKNPRVGKWGVPPGSEYFIEAVKVLKVKGE